MLGAMWRGGASVVSAREAWEKRLKKEQPRTSDGGLGHEELLYRWMDRYPDRAYSRGDWWEYEAGWWRQLESTAVESQIMDVLLGSRDEGVKVTGHLIGSVLRLAKASTYVAADAWDADANVLVCANGTLEIDSRTLREHRPEDHATGALPYEYDPEARAEMFLQVLREAVPDSLEFLQEFAGYSLTTETDLETALWFVGPRGSGKSTVIEGLQSMLGPRHGVLGLAEIESSTFALAKIPGKTLLTSTEQPSSYLRSTHVVDALISGETLTIDRKYRDAEYYAPVAKVIWAMNDKPRIGNTTSGIFRRVKVVEFPKLKRPPDPRVKEAIRGEGAGILNWSLEGLARLHERGHLLVPEAVRTSTEEWEKSNDLPSTFVEEECKVGPNEEAPAGMLYSRYTMWCEDNGHKAQSSTRLADDWKRLGFEKRVVSGRNFWQGVSLKSSGS